MEETIIIATPVGYRVYRPADIGYFVYSTRHRAWQAVMFGDRTLRLRRQTSADDILAVSSSFVRINQSTIINIHYLVLIEEHYIRLCPPFDCPDDEVDLLISRNLRKPLKEKLRIL
ncbi:MAG: LytTR family transcriptional regulator DNA-binding domain-containing protein [Mediterranea sp.]|jgi:hypothetical protein|nr:LytTR family transcriptional regulator DNA-binding domain-containing protein [Mediterranea sp.]